MPLPGAITDAYFINFVNYRQKMFYKIGLRLRGQLGLPNFYSFVLCPLLAPAFQNVCLW